MTQVLVPAFILLLITQFVKWLADKIGVEKSKVMIHGFIFVVAALTIFFKQYWAGFGDWAKNIAIFWSMTVGEYEILKAFYKGLLKK